MAGSGAGVYLKGSHDRSIQASCGVVEKSVRSIDSQMVNMELFWLTRLRIRFQWSGNPEGCRTGRSAGMGKHISLKLLLALTLSCVTLVSYATSASSARIYIKPITYNNEGVVLFKAYKDID